MKKIVVLLATILMIKNAGAQWSTVTGSTANIYNTNTGSVGIGTGNTVPTAFVDVRKDQSTATVVKVRNQSNLSGASARFDLSTYTTNAYQISALYDNGGYPYYQFSVGPAVIVAYHDAPEFMWRSAAGTTNYMKITSSGNVGIGTITPGSFKLAVEGTIGTRAIKVTSVTPWPDYVFLPDYKLSRLNEIEDFIKQNKHLPGIPSAADIKADGGVELGEMNRKLLEKVEELTLHIIDLNKRIEQLEQQK